MVRFQCYRTHWWYADRILPVWRIVAHLLLGRHMMDRNASFDFGTVAHSQIYHPSTQQKQYLC